MCLLNGFNTLLCSFFASLLIEWFVPTNANVPKSMLNHWKRQSKLWCQQINRLSTNSRANSRIKFGNFHALANKIEQRSSTPPNFNCHRSTAVPNACERKFGTGKENQKDGHQRKRKMRKTNERKNTEEEEEETGIIRRHRWSLLCLLQRYAVWSQSSEMHQMQVIRWQRMWTTVYSDEECNFFQIFFSTSTFMFSS